MKILFFAPHAAVWVHAFPEALVAEALQQSGHEVVYVTCGRQLQDFCVPMSANGLTPSAGADARARVCDRCEAAERLLRGEFRFHGPQLASLITPEEKQAVAQLVDGMARERIEVLELDGVPVGRLALYQIMLRHKRIDLDFSPAEWRDYLLELRNTLYAAFAGRRLLDSQRPDRVLVYNGLYSVNRVVCKLAERRGIPAYFMHAGGNLSNRLQTLMLGRGDTFRFMPHLLAQWPRFADVPCSARELSLVTDHYLELLRGRSVFVYSQTKASDSFDVRRRFEVAEHQKLLVATMGSYDEEVAAEMVGAREHRVPLLFQTQVDWIRALIGFITTRPDLFLVIRVHPREFPNRRDARLSQHARLLQQVLNELPPNAAVNWPTDGISMYDLADQTDVFLNSWSSVGKEMSLLGIPVVIYSRELVFYPAELNYLGPTREQYFAAIERALAEGWSLERARQAYRWATFEFSRALLFLGDSYPAVEHPHRSLGRKVTDRLRRRFDPWFVERADCRRRQPRLGAAAQVASVIESGRESVLELLDPESVAHAGLEEETAQLHAELARLGQALYPDAAARAASRLYGALAGVANRN